MGFDPDVEGFFWYAGQGGTGIQTSPAHSAIAAKLILRYDLDSLESEISADFRADRFPAASP
jgi:D-arginine dehydrogenase